MRIEDNRYTVDGLSLQVELIFDPKDSNKYPKIMVSDPGIFGKYLVNAFGNSGFGAEAYAKPEEGEDTCVVSLNNFSVFVPSKGYSEIFTISDRQHAKYCLVNGISPAFLYKVALSTKDTESFPFWYRIATKAEYFDKMQRTIGDRVLRSSIDSIMPDKKLEKKISMELEPSQLEATKSRLRERVEKFNAAGSVFDVEVERKLGAEVKRDAERSESNQTVLTFAGRPGAGAGPQVSEGAGAVQAGAGITAAAAGNAVPSHAEFNAILKQLGDSYATLSPEQQRELFKVQQDLVKRFTVKPSVGSYTGGPGASMG